MLFYNGGCIFGVVENACHQLRVGLT